MKKPPFQKPPADADQERSLRDYLAMDRTILANRRTLLAFIRTGIYFIFTGLAILNIETLQPYFPYSIPLFVIGLGVIIAGIVTYFKVKRRIVYSYKDPQKEK